MRGGWLVVALALATTACGVRPPSVVAGPGNPSGPSPISSSATPTPSGTPTTSDTTPTARPTTTTRTPRPTTATTSSVPEDTRGSSPWTVRGIAVVSKKHRVTAAYVPAWASSQPNGLSSDTNAAVRALIAAAKKKGITIRVRSGYRSYATQQSSYQRGVARYGKALASKYFAEPGASEHQTGLSCDLTDAAGNRGADFARTPAADFIAKHATEFGLIVRYPPGKQAITGYEWEPWHVRYVGTKVSAAFAGHPGLTLEQYLGLA